MKIGITFFGSKLDLLCISKVLTIFCVFSKIRWKKKRSRGHVACSPSARGSLSVWGSRGTAHSESSREGLSGLGHAGHVAGSGASGGFSRQGYSGTGVLLGGLPDMAYGLDTRGQGSYSEGFRRGGPKGFRLASGTRGFLLKVPKGVPAKASKGHSAGLCDGSERVSGHAARSEGLRKGVASGWHVPKGSSKGFPRGSP